MGTIVISTLTTNDRLVGNLRTLTLSSELQFIPETGAPIGSTASGPVQATTS